MNLLRFLFTMLCLTSTLYSKDGEANPEAPSSKNNRHCISLLGAMAQFQNHLERTQFDSDYSWSGLLAARAKLFEESSRKSLADLKAIANIPDVRDSTAPNWLQKKLGTKDLEKIQRFVAEAEKSDDRKVLIGLKVEDPYEIEEFRSFVRDLRSSYILEASNEVTMEDRVQRKIPQPELLSMVVILGTAYGLHKFIGMNFNHAVSSVVGVTAVGAIAAQKILMGKYKERHQGTAIDPSIKLGQADQEENSSVDVWGSEMSLSGVNRAISASSISPATPNQVARGATDYDDYWKTIVSISQIDQQSLMEHPKFKDRDLVNSNWILVSGTNADGSSYINIAVILRDMTTSPRGGDSGPPPWMGRHLGIDEREKAPE